MVSDLKDYLKTELVNQNQNQPAQYNSFWDYLFNNYKKHDNKENGELENDGGLKFR